ncbi:MAG TPA: hypothetical protein EYH45_07680 [Candidatus Caldiarchaeum subterraneum]|uniref:Geranylgeranylglycerol-phosphate geranylgeranyltransferase n=1 Tax=Caldiarchaeum subterraneum TaxID=311458 RepID=A0A833A5L1_CALS0|nr:hypothetical protein [Aigarchaeota archaeon]HIQ30423.1 hypothetical protein [Candidatus Caldarchaeum subterraneum]
MSDRGVGSKVRALVKMTRPPNGVLMFIAVVVGVIFSDRKMIDPTTLLLAFITAYGLNSSSMVINDYFDKEVDKINHPNRPIPLGIVKPQEAVTYSFSLAILGLAAAYLTSIQALLFASFAYAVSFAYNAYMKKRGILGNVMVSVDVVAPFIYGSIIADGVINPRILSFAFLAFLANTGREVIKGMVDVEGDAVRGVDTIARKHGLRKAAFLGSGMYLAAVTLSPLPYLLGYVSLAYLPIVLLADIGFIYSAASITTKPNKENAKRQKNHTLIWMLIALIAFILGGAARI